MIKKYLCLFLKITCKLAFRNSWKQENERFYCLVNDILYFKIFERFNFLSNTEHDFRSKGIF